MSIFGSILGKIFGHAEAATPAPAPAQPGSTSTFNNPSATPASPGQTLSPPPAQGAAPTSGSPAAPPPAPPSGSTAPAATVDVAAILNGLAAKSAQKLDWQHSIVDMMKLLGLDSSLSARKALAEELHYGGSTDDSAAMNIWLHKQVMEKLAANGGKVPDDLK